MQPVVKTRSEFHGEVICIGDLSSARYEFLFRITSINAISLTVSRHRVAARGPLPRMSLQPTINGVAAFLLRGYYRSSRFLELDRRLVEGREMLMMRIRNRAVAHRHSERDAYGPRSPIPLTVLDARIVGSRTVLGNGE